MGDPSDYDATRAADWVLMRLDKCLGKKLGFVTLATEPPALTRDLKSAGYPYDRRDRGGITVDPACRIAGTRQRVWLNDCAALAGNSGSPIFSEIEQNGRTVLYVYAMQSAAHEFIGAGAVQTRPRERRDAHGRDHSAYRRHHRAAAFKGRAGPTGSDCRSPSLTRSQASISGRLAERRCGRTIGSSAA